MLSLQNHPAYSIASTSDFSGNDLSSDHDARYRDSTRSVAESPTFSYCPAIKDNGSPATSGGTDGNSKGSDGERQSSCSSTGWGVRVYQNPFAESPLVSPSSPTVFESPPVFGYTTNTLPHDDVLNDYVAPKIEELDDGEELHQVKPTDVGTGQNATGLPVNVPRKRGRPRKHPHPDPSPAKVTKGRSKTGCATCRRRKKKCDETKPTYMSLLLTRPRGH